MAPTNVPSHKVSLDGASEVATSPSGALEFGPVETIIPTGDLTR